MSSVLFVMMTMVSGDEGKKPTTTRELHEMARQSIAKGDFATAIMLNKKVLAAFRKVTPDGSWLLVSTQCGIDELVFASTAKKVAQDAYIGSLRDNAAMIKSLRNKEYERAAEIGESCLKNLIDAGFGDFDTAVRVRYQLAKAYLQLDRYEIAEKYARTAVAKYKDEGKRDHPDVVRVKRELYGILLATGKSTQAREVVEECMRHFDAQEPPYGNRANLHDLRGETEEELGLLVRAHEDFLLVCQNARKNRLTLSNAPQVYAALLGKIAVIQAKFHNHTIAKKLLDTANAEVDSLRNPSRRVRTYLLFVESEVLRETGKLKESRNALAEQIGIYERKLWDMEDKLRLANACLGLSDLDSAEAIYNELEEDVNQYVVPHARFLLGRARLQLLNGNKEKCQDTIRHTFKIVSNPEFDLPKNA